VRHLMKAKLGGMGNSVNPILNDDATAHAAKWQQQTLQRPTPARHSGAALYTQKHEWVTKNIQENAINIKIECGAAQICREHTRNRLPYGEFEIDHSATNEIE
jgi:hypothetical protein